MSTPRIYVACLAAYNNGRLHGRWIAADQSADEIQEEIQSMLSESPEACAEEWAIHDYEGFHSLSIGEYDDIDTIAQLAELIGEHGSAFAAYADHVGRNHASPEGFEEAYRGEWDSEEAYGENLFDELYGHDLPDHIAPYIDYEKYSRDLFINDCYSIDSESGVHVFDHS